MGPATANLQLTITPDLKDPAFKLPSGQVFSLTELTRCLSAVFAFAYLLDDVLKPSPSAAISCVSEIFKKRLQLESIPSPLAPSHSNDLFRDANLVSVLTPLVDDEKNIETILEQLNSSRDRSGTRLDIEELLSKNNQSAEARGKLIDYLNKLTTTLTGLNKLLVEVDSFDKDKDRVLCNLKSDDQVFIDLANGYAFLPDGAPMTLESGPQGPGLLWLRSGLLIEIPEKKLEPRKTDLSLFGSLTLHQTRWASLLVPGFEDRGPAQFDARFDYAITRQVSGTIRFTGMHPDKSNILFGEGKITFSPVPGDESADSLITKHEGSIALDLETGIIQKRMVQADAGF